MALDCRADCVVFDNMLSPSQQREWERLIDECVIDREEVILDIFARRARTREATLQVELARMQYSLPRMARMWNHLDRQGGGSGGGKGGGGAASEVDMAVAKLVVPEICDGACLQLGIGSMPNAIGKMIAESDLKDLGVHTEMYVDAFVDMSIAGRITGLRKPFDRGRQTYAFAAGTQKLYDFIDNNPECMAAPVSYVNDIARVSQIDNFISINGAVDIDLYGQVSSESSGIHHISGAGGQQDFVMGAYLSKGGKSFICCSSSYMDKKSGQLKSRIRPTLLEGSVVTATRTNLHYVVTEYGKFNAKGKSTWERAEGLIAIAHPQFREELIAEAEKMHIWRRSNKR